MPLRSKGGKNDGNIAICLIFVGIPVQSQYRSAKIAKTNTKSPTSVTFRMKSTPAFLGSTLLYATLSVAHAGETPQNNPAPAENKMAASLPDAKTTHASAPSPSSVTRNTERTHERVNDILVRLPEMTAAQSMSASDARIMSMTQEGVRASIGSQAQFVMGHSKTGVRLGMEWNLSDELEKKKSGMNMKFGVGVMGKGRVGFAISIEN